MNKLYLIFLLLCPSILLGQLTALTTYVWEFTSQQSEYEQQASWITENFENEILRYKNLYRVVERRNLAELKEHQQLNEVLKENQPIQRVSLKNELDALQAEAFFRGELLYDEGSGEFRIKVSLNALTGSQEKYKQAEVTLRKGQINDNESRKEIVRKLFDQLHEEERMSVLKNTEELLDEYLFVTQELQTEILSMNAWMDMKVMMRSNKKEAESIKSKYEKALLQFSEKIKNYNDVIENIKNNQSQISNAFCLYWDGIPCRDYDRLLEDIIGFHDRLLWDDTNDLVNTVNNFIQATKSKEEKALRLKIDEVKAEIKDDLSRDLPDMKYKIRSFKDQISINN